MNESIKKKLGELFGDVLSMGLKGIDHV